MFEVLIESGRRYPRPPLGAVAVSAFTNAAVAFAAVTATRAPEAPLPGAVETREVVYLLPLPPRRVPFEPVGVTYYGGDGLGSAAKHVDAASQFPDVVGGDRGKGAGRRGAKKSRGESADSALLAGEIAGGRVYVESEIDRPVTFDPSSAAPAYPPDLQMAEIEGYARMRFIVDSTGVADTTTLNEIDVTHPGFAAAVREALPHMRFRPAELGDRRVRQLVEQQFNFRIQFASHNPPPDSTPAPTPPAR